MHNSQGGMSMAWEFNGSGFARTEAPNPTLLTKSCVGCHTNVDPGTLTVDNGTPIVFTINEPTNPLAGGNFWYTTASDANGHNVLGITGADSIFQSKNIPGSTTSYYLLTCAGTHGCHGDRVVDDELQAIKGAHHTNDSGGVVGSSVGLSYRFLDGILGVENTDWEQDNNSSSHNIYKGASNSFNDSTTISYLCGECHSTQSPASDGYHSIDGVCGSSCSSPWLRHPTDYLLPQDGEYGGYVGYSMTAPVAYTDPSSPDRASAVVMCLSCHRAHASPNYKIMRWDYRGWPVAGTNGCAVCHTWKN